LYCLTPKMIQFLPCRQRSFSEVNHPSKSAMLGLLGHAEPMPYRRV
jgi:hypothetical protein